MFQRSIQLMCIIVCSIKATATAAAAAAVALTIFLYNIHCTHRSWFKRKIQMNLETLGIHIYLSIKCYFCGRVYCKSFSTRL